jgi:hypothetical protein
MGLSHLIDASNGTVLGRLLKRELLLDTEGRLMKLLALFLLCFGNAAASASEQLREITCPGVEDVLLVL